MHLPFPFCTNAAPFLLVAATFFCAKFINVLHRLPALLAAGGNCDFCKKKLPSSQIWNSFFSDWIGSNVSLEELASGKGDSTMNVCTMQSLAEAVTPPWALGGTEANIKRSQNMLNQPGSQKMLMRPALQLHLFDFGPRKQQICIVVFTVS